MDRRSPSPQDHGLLHDGTQKQIPDVPLKKTSLEQHLMILGLSPHQSSDQPPTNEASPSGLDGQRARQTADGPAERKDLSFLSSAHEVVQPNDPQYLQDLAELARLKAWWENSRGNETKDVLTPQMEQFLKSIPIGEDGNRAPKGIELSTHATPEHPILVGGMKRFFSKGEMSQERDEKLREQARLWEKQGEYKKAKQLYKEIFDNCKRRCGLSHSETAAALTDLADVYTTQRQFEKAKGKYQSALAIYEHVLKADDSRIDAVRARLCLGQQFGNYHLVKLLGQGGFASVYLGEHVDPKEPPTAVKVLSTRRLVDPIHAEAFRKQFLTEAKTLKKLDHPHIVRILAYGAKDDSPFFVMPLARGTLLDALPSDRPVPIKKALPYLKPLAQALQYVHDNHFVHLDLKPANVLLGAQGEVLLSDFGLAQVVHRTVSLVTSEQRPLIAGSRPYMDPHYAATGLTSHKSDQYAFSMIAFQSVSGEYFLPSDRTIPGIAQEVQDALFKGLDPDPDNRFNSVIECYEALEQACSPRVQQKMRTLRSHLRDLDQEKPEEASELQERQERGQNEHPEGLLQAHYASLEQHRRADRYKANFPSELGLVEHETFALMSHGMTHLRLGQPEQARANFNQVLEVDKNNANAVARRGATYLQEGQREQGLG